PPARQEGVRSLARLGADGKFDWPLAIRPAPHLGKNEPSLQEKGRCAPPRDGSARAKVTQEASLTSAGKGTITPPSWCGGCGTGAALHTSRSLTRRSRTTSKRRIPVKRHVVTFLFLAITCSFVWA